MSTNLTKKQKGFVKDYIKTGIGTLAVKENYDVTDDNTARSIASENLTKPSIQKAIADRLPDDLLEERHLELLNKRETFTVYDKIKDEEGKEKTVPRFIDIGPEVQAVSKGLDMAYKIKGSYAPEKNINVNVEVENDEDIKALAEQINALHSRPSIESNGTDSDSMDKEIQD